jgi:hypothetical protein
MGGNSTWKAVRGSQADECYGEMTIVKNVHQTMAPAYPRVSSDGLGQPRLREHLIARRHNLLGPTNWKLLKSITLDEAREQFKAGTHLMVQARDGDWTLQYLIPRKEAGSR